MNPTPLVGVVPDMLAYIVMQQMFLLIKTPLGVISPCRTWFVLLAHLTLSSTFPETVSPMTEKPSGLTLHLARSSYGTLLGPMRRCSWSHSDLVRLCSPLGSKEERVRQSIDVASTSRHRRETLVRCLSFSEPAVEMTFLVLSKD